MAALHGKRSGDTRDKTAVCALDAQALPATDEDWATEYSDLFWAVKIAESLDEAINHIACLQHWS